MTSHDTVPTTFASRDIVRPLGSFENLFDLYTQDLPVQFSVIAELDRAVTPEEARDALVKIQASQPLLAVGVQRTDDGAGFYRSTLPIPLVVAPSGTPWDELATLEQAWAIDVTSAPLARCTLSTTADSSVIVMTFAHQIADGLSAVATVRELVDALNGRALPTRAFPRSQESLLSNAFAARQVADADAPQPAAAESRLLAGADSAGLNRVGSVRPFNSVRPNISGLRWSADLTQRAIEAARTHSTTLHALITAAAVRVLFAHSDRDFVAMMNPMDLRRPTGADDSLALYFLSTRLGFTPENCDDIWALAREVREQLRSAQTLEQLAGMSGGMSAATASVARVEDAVGAMVAFANYDLMITNLGDLGSGNANREGEIGITDIFGPTMATQIEGEQILALSSFDGRLRTTVTTRNPIPGFLENVRQEVETALHIGE